MMKSWLRITEAQRFDTQTHLARVLAGSFKKTMNRSSRGIGSVYLPLITPLTLLSCELLILSTLGLSMVSIDHLNVLVSEMFGFRD